MITSGVFPDPLQGLGKAEIDTASPFESVKEAVTLFGERMEWRSPPQKPSIVEKQNALEPDLQKIREDIVHLKEQLINTKKATFEIFGDLNETRKGLQELAGRLGFQISAEHIAMHRRDLDSAHIEAEAEMKAVMEEIDSVRMDIQFLDAAKEAAQKQSGNLMASWDTMSEKVEELTAELKAANDTLASAQLARMEAEEQMATLRGEIEANEGLRTTLAGQKVEMGQSPDTLESSLEKADPIATELKVNLREARESQEKAAITAAEAERNLVDLKLELDHAKSLETEAVNELGRVCNEIDEAKANLKHLSDETSSLSSKLELLKAQLDKEMTELESARKNESSACTTLASFQAEIAKVREELISATSGETKAKELRCTLPNAIKSTAARADELKAHIQAFKEDMRKAKHETEEVRAATRAVESRLQAALKEAEAAKVSEAMAIAEFKALTGSEAKATVSVSEMETDATMIISLEEYGLLHQKAQEAEEVSLKQVAMAFEQVDEAKVSHLEAQKRLETINKEIEICKKTMEEALKKADEAQSAKLAAEGELRRWRGEHEQRRKSGHIPATQTIMPLIKSEAAQGKINNDKELSKSAMRPSLQDRKVMKLDSLAQVLSLKVPASQNPAKVLLPSTDLPKEKKKKENTSISYGLICHREEKARLE